jgi:hypothetical protein
VNSRFSPSVSESQGRTTSSSTQPFPSALVASMYGLIGDSSALSVMTPIRFCRSNASSRYAS